MFVMTYLVAVCFAARNKKDMVEGVFFFAGQFVLFLIGKNSYSSFKSNFFFSILCYQLYSKEITDPKTLFPLLLKILFSIKIRGEMKRNHWNENDKYV